MGGCKGVMMICSLLALVLLATTHSDALRVLPGGPNFYTKLTSNSGTPNSSCAHAQHSAARGGVGVGRDGEAGDGGKRTSGPTWVHVLTLDLNKNSLLHMDFTLTDDKSLQQAKHLEVDMLKQAIVQMQGKKSIIFDAIEDPGSNVRGDDPARV